MVKFSATNKETELPVIGIGLSRENCDLLLAGQPIHFDTSGMVQFGTPLVEISIIAGETDQALAGKLIALGVLTPDQIRFEQPGSNERTQ